MGDGRSEAPLPTLMGWGGGDKGQEARVLMIWVWVQPLLLCLVL